MNLVYASDENFAMIMSVSLQSAFEVHRDIEDMSVFIIDNGLSDASIDALKKQASNMNRFISFVRVDTVQAFASIPLKYNSTWSSAAYARLYLAQLLPNEERVIYLDCDTIVLHSLQSLWDTNLQGYSCAAVKEPFSRFHKHNIDLPHQADYWNSGVMLIDLSAWRSIKIERKFSDFIQKMDGAVPFVDQGVINNVLQCNILSLAPSYNVMTIYFDLGYKGASLSRGAANVYTEGEIDLAIKNPIVVHFTNSFVSNRPWLEGSRHPYVQQWLSLRNQTQWAQAPLWGDKRSAVKKISRRIVNLLPRRMGLYYIYLVNAVIRPLLGK